LFTCDPSQENLQDSVLSEEIGAKVLHKRGISGDWNGEVVSILFTCLHVDQDAEVTTLNSTVTAYLQTMHKGWLEDNNITWIYGDAVIRVVQGTYQDNYLQKYISDIQGETLEDTVTNVELLKRISRLN